MSGRFRHGQHVVRMAGLFALGIAAFVVARAIFVPDDFGRFGHYRAAALELNRQRPIAYAGHAACVDCHGDIVEKRVGQRHERVGCEACHGPAARHASGEENAPKPARPDGRKACLVCHAKDASRPVSHPQVIAAEHAGDESCLTCHNPHAPRVS